MKKISAIIIAFVLCLALTACAQKSQNVKDTEVMIKAIGTVTDQSGDDIMTAEKFYNKLTDEEKGQVSNFSTLSQARETYNKLIVYGQWEQFGMSDSVTFTLAEDGSFTMSDGKKGSYEITDDEIILHADDGDRISMKKNMDKNLLHLKTDDADFIRPDLLTTDRHKIVSSSWYRFFDLCYHVHVEKDESGLDKDYWNCYSLVPNAEYADYIAPGTNISVTLSYTSRDIATMYNPDKDNLLIVDELTDPVEHTVTVEFTDRSFANIDSCCDPDFDLVRGTASRYDDFKYIYKTLNYLENGEITAFEGELYYYDQLKD